jgi:endonuclease-3
MTLPKRKSDPQSAAGRILWVCRNLEKTYGVPKARSKDSPLDVLIRTILSQNTNDTNRDRAYDKLVKKYPSWETVATARLSEIERVIEAAGLYRQKSRAIKGLLSHLKKRDGRLDRRFLCRMESSEAVNELTALKGIGIKTVSVALMFGCGRDDVFPVDTHVLRVSKRLELLSEKTTAERAHTVLGDLVPRGKGASLHLNMIRLGREVCRARKPLCAQCALSRRCPWHGRNRVAAGA